MDSLYLAFIAFLALVPLIVYVSVRIGAHAFFAAKYVYFEKVLNRTAQGDSGNV